jgi:putative transposase
MLTFDPFGIALVRACCQCQTTLMDFPHRKRCKRYDVPGDAHALTFSCFHRLPLFSPERACHWMLDALKLGQERDRFDLWAYVVMPEHVHLVILPHQGAQISRILKTIKQSVSQHALRWLEINEPRFLARLQVVHSNGRSAFRFW